MSETMTEQYLNISLMLRKFLLVTVKGTLGISFLQSVERSQIRLVFVIGYSMPWDDRNCSNLLRTYNDNDLMCQNQMV